MRKLFLSLLASVFLLSQSYAEMGSSRFGFGPMGGSNYGIGANGEGTGSDSIYRGYAVLPAFTAMNTEKVAFVGIGDSNQMFGGHGWDQGWQYGLITNGFTMYSAGLHGANASSGQGYTPSGGGNMGHMSFTTGSASASGVPSGLTTYNSGTVGGPNGINSNPNGWDYLDDTGDFSSNNNGYFIDDLAMNTNNLIRWQVYYGTFLDADGAGQLRLSIRAGSDGGFTRQISGSTITTAGASPNAYGIAEASLDLTPATRNFSLQGQIYNSVDGTHLLGPSFLLYDRMVDETVTKGFAYQSMIGWGGQSLYDFAYALQQASDATLSKYLELVRQECGTNKIVVFTINGGANDRNEASAPSLGPSPASPGDSSAAYSDNFNAIYIRIRAIYDLNGWDKSKLYFVWVPSHQVSSPDDSELVSYRTAAKALANNLSNTAVVDLTKIFTYEEAVANSWYNTGGDTIHVVRAGSETFGFRIVRDILNTPSQ